MQAKTWKQLLLIGCGLLMASVSYGKCYPGLDCPEDLPGNDNPAPTTPTPKPNDGDWQIIDRYMVKDGLVKDPTTGLMWMRCSVGQTWNGWTCAGKASEVKWEKAMSIPKNIDYADYSDWRVPTIKELNTLVYCSNDKTIQYKQDGYDSNSGCGENYERPTIVQGAFPSTSAMVFWSSSPYASGRYDAWVVYFDGGSDGHSYKTYNNNVRLVRGGQ